MNNDLSVCRVKFEISARGLSEGLGTNGALLKTLDKKVIKLNTKFNRIH